VTFARPVLAVAVVVGAGLVASCDSNDGRQLEPPTEEQRAAMTTTTTTPPTVAPGLPPDVGAASSQAPGTAAAAFTMTAPWPDGGAIEARFTCDGADISPAVSWTAPPAGTVELALLVRDDDAGGFVHWAVAGIAPTAGGIAEGGNLPRAIQGETSFGETGWGGPCPPSGTHTYRFTLYALSQQAELAEGFGASELSVYTDTSSLATAEVTGTYTRG
jgi:Raf kinase inhibitor-like YbhB/YbcL family protein